MSQLKKSKKVFESMNNVRCVAIHFSIHELSHALNC